jgi:hypothetical protein
VGLIGCSEMASGYTVSGRGDLDTLFKLRTGTKRPDVAFKVADVDISNRYEQIAGGSPIAATGFKAAGGVDLSTLFKNVNDVGAVAITPTFIDVTVPGPNYTTVLITASQAGATTYTWTLDSVAGGISINSPNSQSTTLSTTGLTSGAHRYADLRCTTNTGATSTISITIHGPP